MSTETPVVETPQVEPVVEEPSTLPSQNQEVDYSGFELSDDIKNGMKNEKINGRFGSVQEILDKLKETEDKFANDVRTNKDNQTQTTEEQTAELTKQALGFELEKEFMENGMVLTDEMIERGVAGGYSADTIELRSIKLKDKTNKGYNFAGGAEKYDEMVSWARENMTEEQRKSFNTDANGNKVMLSEYAIKGLHADYQKAMADGTVTTRIQGQPVNQGIVAYKNQKELFADKTSAERAKQRGNMNDWNIYQRKLEATKKLSGGIFGLPKF